MKDALDLLNPRARYTAQGTFYAERPIFPDVGGESFDYEQVDPRSYAFRRLFGDFHTFDGGQTAIRTNQNLAYKANGYIVLSDGSLWLINEVAKDYARAPHQSLRLLGLPINVDFVIRMTPLENPWGIK